MSINEIIMNEAKGFEPVWFASIIKTAKKMLQNEVLDAEKATMRPRTRRGQNERDI